MAESVLAPFLEADYNSENRLAMAEPVLAPLLEADCS